MSKNKAIKKPIYTAEELNSNIAYGMTTINNITQAELNSIQWLCEKSMNDDIKIKNLQSQLAITQKALELALKEELRGVGVYDEDYGSKEKFTQLIEEYMQEAKDILKNEK